MSAPLSKSRFNLPDAIRLILAARGLSLADISRLSRVRFAGKRLFRIPPNFYEALRRPSFSPSLHQLFALSALTGYRLADWLGIFGLSFDDAARFQAAWPRYQTAELDARVYDPSALIPWYQEARHVWLGARLTPLSQWLSGKVVRRLDSLTSTYDASFRYLKIGSRDAYAFPDLLPGSIVRIDGRLPPDQLLAEGHAERILAIEHNRGFVCSRVRPVGHGRIVLCSRQLPYAPVELQLGTEAKILGVVDLEIRSLASLEMPEVSASAAQVWTPGIIEPSSSSDRIGDWIRRVRIRCGLSFREASKRTREIAKILGHPNYFCAPSTLSDIEARDLFPRHLHKLISLSAVYCVPIADVAGLAGLRTGDVGQEAMPDEWKPTWRGRQRLVGMRPSYFLEAVRGNIEEVPYFLRDALPPIVGLPNLSVRDLFWAGATTDLFHPYLRNSLFLAINRQSKTPAPSLSSPVWAQPLYILETRDGNRSCAACSLQNGILMVRPCTTTSRRLLRLRNRIDAEVIGKVVAIARRVSTQESRSVIP
jgi:transcriptional regulator with XRE-family HTH domain